jgi:two-component system response regulator LytT
MTLLVVEEAEDVVHEIRNILDRIDSSIRIVGVTHDMLSVATWLKKNAIPDLILVNAGVVSDLQIINHKEAKAMVTFSTDSDAYNFEAFRFATFRQLMNKLPGNGDFFENSIIRRSLKVGNGATYRERFLVKQGQRLHSIHINEIAYFFSEGRFIFFKTFDNQKYITEYRIEMLETMLNPRSFFRINRSHIISLTTVKQIHAWFGNRLKLFLEPEADIDIIVSRERVKKFKAWLGK